MSFNTKGLMSSVRQDWKTPKEFYNRLKEEFFFDYDPCPTDSKNDGSDIRFWVDFVIPAVQKRDKNKCVKCGSTKNLQIHHLSYSKDISIKDLQTLCCSCHRKQHSKKEVSFHMK